MKSILVYIASPYTGNPLANTERQIAVADELRKHGFLPYWPLCTHYWHSIYRHDYEYWMAMDFEWIERADCLLRLAGESEGADREVAHAEELGIPVYYSINELSKEKK